MFNFDLGCMLIMQLYTGRIFEASCFRIKWIIEFLEGGVQEIMYIQFRIFPKPIMFTLP